MGNETAVPARRKRRLDERGRIFARLREGYAYDEIAREEQLSPERGRQIVREALARRLVDEPGTAIEGPARSPDSGEAAGQPDEKEKMASGVGASL